MIFLPIHICVTVKCKKKIKICFTIAFRRHAILFEILIPLRRRHTFNCAEELLTGHCKPFITIPTPLPTRVYTYASIMFSLYCPAVKTYLLRFKTKKNII